MSGTECRDVFTDGTIEDQIGGPKVEKVWGRRVYGELVFLDGVYGENKTVRGEIFRGLLFVEN